mmetsp:Transcript_134126/g.251019  ORF Transcript_134126/g.251019 Transcript_134126/m.251019 type:complete len:206 (-) Transcript_134126:250-867(-)
MLKAVLPSVLRVVLRAVLRAVPGQQLHLPLQMSMNTKKATGELPLDPEALELQNMVQPELWPHLVVGLLVLPVLAVLCPEAAPRIPAAWPVLLWMPAPLPWAQVSRSTQTQSIPRRQPVELAQEPAVKPAAKPAAVAQLAPTVEVALILTLGRNSVQVPVLHPRWSCPRVKRFEFYPVHPQQHHHHQSHYRKPLPSLARVLQLLQ